MKQIEAIKAADEVLCRGGAMSTYSLYLAMRQLIAWGHVTAWQELGELNRLERFMLSDEATLCWAIAAKRAGVHVKVPK